MRTTLLTTSLLVWAVPGLYADVTIRFRNEMVFGAVMPAPIAEKSKNGTESGLPATTAIYRKGSNAYIQSGKFACLMDFAKQEVTVIDGEHKTFATVPMKDYRERLAAALAALAPKD